MTYEFIIRDVKTKEDLFFRKKVPETYQDSIKVLEIIKHHYSLDIYKGNYYLNGARICEEEYKLLKEILK